MTQSELYINTVHFELAYESDTITFMFLRYRLNYKYAAVHTGSFDKQSVLKKDGEVIMVQFIDFIECEEVKLSNRAIPFKIKSITAYSKFNFNFIDLPQNCLLHGCILNGGLYSVVEQDTPGTIYGTL